MTAVRNAPGNPLRLIAFDFDGVICDSVDVKAQAFRALYADHGETVADAVVAYHHAHGGLNRLDKIRHYERALLGRPGDDASVQAKADRFAELVVDSVIAAPLRAGVADCLDRLAGRLPLHIVSATPQVELERIVAAKGLTGAFQSLHGAPGDKAGHLTGVLARAAVAAEQAAFVGDAIADLEAARAVGLAFVPVAAPDGTHPFPADCRVRSDMVEVDACLARWAQLAPVEHTQARP